MIERKNASESASEAARAEVVRPAERAPGFLALHLISGAGLLMLLAWLFGLVAEDVVEGDALTAADQPLALWCHQHAAQPVLGLMWTFTTIGSIASISLLTAITGVWLRRQRYWLLALVMTVPGGMLLNIVLKHLFHRTRPHFDDPFLTLSTYSFPSGHALGSTLHFGFLCLYGLTSFSGRGTRSAIIASTVIMVMSVAFSRVYLGAHYLTDVIAGITIGLAWLTVSFTGVAALFHKRHPSRTLLSGKS